MTFQKAVKVVLVLIAVIVLGLAVAHDLSPSSPVAHTSEMDKGEHVLDVYGSTINLPLVYQSSAVRSRSSEVFAAASAKVLFTVKLVMDEEHISTDQVEMVDVLFTSSQSSTKGESGYVQTSATKEMIGNNYFLVMQGQRVSADGYNTDYITQYMTYHKGGVYIFDFVTPWKDSYSRNDFDMILSTVGFK
jgi:hypothetical protein